MWVLKEIFSFLFEMNMAHAEIDQRGNDKNCYGSPRPV